MSLLSHCPAWCELPAGHRSPIHSTTIAQYVGVSVQVVAYATYRPCVKLLARGDEAAVLAFDAEQARALATVLAATGADDVARALREASTVLEGAAS